MPLRCPTCIACLYFVIVLVKMGKNSVITFGMKEGRPQRENMTAVFAVGVPSAIATLLFDLDYVIIDKLMVSYHDLALAAIGIVLKVERFPLNVGIGICQGMMPLVAYSYAAGNRKRMEDTVRLSRGLGLLIALISIVLYELFTAQFIRIFISDAQTIHMASNFLRIRVLATPLMFLSFFYRLSVSGFRQRPDRAVPWRGQMAGVQYSHAVFAEPPCRYVRYRLVPGSGGHPDGDLVVLRVLEVWT